MLHIENTILVCIDIQESLAKAMFDRERLVANTRKLIAGFNAFTLPILWTEQNPERLGPTLPEIAEVMPAGARPVSKMSFSCCGSEEFVAALKAHRRPDVLLAGIETHICVLQTAMELAGLGFRVQVAADCVCSRTPQNNAIGIERMRSMGVQITSVETALFELLGSAAAPAFKEIAKLVK
ncbi:MAG: hydrolase [Proteobacteria bacterium]|nr:hydrolase [Pseudomonadota bacterium]